MRIIYILLITISFSPNAFSQEAQYINGKKYKGYSFPENHNAFVGILNQSSKFFPDENVIEHFESELSNRIVDLTKDLPDQGERCPNIRRKLRKYIRQYFGFVTMNNERVLYVNFVWTKKEDFILRQLDSEFLNFYGGCSFYWNLKYNLDTNEFYDLRVNTKD